ncbi:fimbrial protein [Oceanisphaera sp. KMM 10153]|uniref:fimbrial protein n=1 Tax=Oceanisphaera submarina TaxID=3390193 RepID=UPI003974F2FD
MNYTCIVATEGSEGSDRAGDATIALPTIASPALRVPGERAGMRQFAIQVGSVDQPCEAVAVTARWAGTGSNVDQDSGRLNNQRGSGYASGVQVSILNDRQQDIDLRSNANSQEVELTNGMAMLLYHGEYYTSGILQEGMVETGVEYQLEYR